MKIGIIIPNNLWFCPFVSIYTDLLDKHNVPYEIISWCRDGKSEIGCVEYLGTDNRKGIFKFLSYWKFASFVKRTIKANSYDKLIVFTPQTGIFIARYLKRNYKGRYIFDYRDLSIEQSFLFKYSFKKLLNNSVVNVISSPGFRMKLPAGYDYILSHNFNIELVMSALANSEPSMHANTDSIIVLTIGGIRDYESNVQLIDALANIEGYSLRFVGKGPSASDLQSHAEEINADNVSFEGYYPKELEKKYVLDSTFINIYYPRKPSHDTALSNRFYNSLIYRKPMITTANTIQGEYASRYKVGVAIENCNSLPVVLKEYLSDFDEKTYVNNCNDLLAEFVRDYKRWEATVLNFIN